MIFKPNTVSPNMESISLEDDEVLTLSLKGVSAPEIYDKARLFIRQNDTEKYYYTNIETKSQGNYEVTCQINRAGVGEFIESDENNYIVNITNDDGGKIAPKIQKTSTTWKLRLYEKDSLNEDSECIFYPELDLRSSDIFMARDVKTMSDLYCQNTYFKPYLNYYALASLSDTKKESMLICNNYIPSSQIAYGTVQSSDNVTVHSSGNYDPSFGVHNPFPQDMNYVDYLQNQPDGFLGKVTIKQGFYDDYFTQWTYGQVPYVLRKTGSEGDASKFKVLKIYPHSFSNQLMFGVAGIKSYQAANNFDYNKYTETNTMHEFMTKGAYEKIKDYDNKYARYYIKINGVFYKILDWRYFDWSHGAVVVKNNNGWDDNYFDYDKKGFVVGNGTMINLAYPYNTGTGEDYIYSDAYYVNRNNLYCMEMSGWERSSDNYLPNRFNYRESLSPITSSEYDKIPKFIDNYGNPLAMYVLIYTGDREIAEGENYEIYCNYTDTDQYSFQIKGSSSFKINVNNEQKTLFNDKSMALSKGNLSNLDSTNLSITGALYGSSTISSYSISLYQYKNNKEYLIDESTYNFSQSIIYMYDNLLNNSNYLLYVKIRDSDNNIHEGYLGLYTNFKTTSINNLHLDVFFDREKCCNVINFDPLDTLRIIEPFEYLEQGHSFNTYRNNSNDLCAYIYKGNYITYDKSSGISNELSVTDDFVANLVANIDTYKVGNICKITKNNGCTCTLKWDGVHFYYESEFYDGSVETLKIYPYKISIDNDNFESIMIDNLKGEDGSNNIVPYVVTEDFANSEFDSSLPYNVDNTFSSNWFSFIMTSSGISIKNISDLGTNGIRVHYCFNKTEKCDNFPEKGGSITIYDELSFARLHLKNQAIQHKDGDEFIKHISSLRFDNDIWDDKSVVLVNIKHSNGLVDIYGDDVERSDEERALIRNIEKYKVYKTIGKDNPIIYKVFDSNVRNKTIEDYAVGNRCEYQYYIYPVFINSNGLQELVSPMISNKIKVNSDKIVVVGLIQNDENFSIDKDNIYVLELNIKDNGTTFNTNKNFVDTQNKYQQELAGIRSYKTRSFSALLGRLDCNTSKILDDFDLLNKWESFCTSSSLKMLVDLRGKVILGDIDNNPTEQYEENFGLNANVSFSFRELSSLSDTDVLACVSTKEVII